jgi:hypothetical protein
MNRGRLVCLGTPHHLKARFGACYDIEVICSSVEAGAPGGQDLGAGSSSSSKAAAAGGSGGDEQLQLSPAQHALLSQLRGVMPGLVVREAAWGRLRLSLPLGPGAPPLSRVFEVSGSKVSYVWYTCHLELLCLDATAHARPPLCLYNSALPCAPPHLQALESLKSSGSGLVSAYSVGQPSLESVFLAVCGHSLTSEGDYVQQQAGANALVPASPGQVAGAQHDLHLAADIELGLTSGRV